jgi:hypothetical protein
LLDDFEPDPEDLDPDPDDLEVPLVELLLLEVVDLFASVLPEVDEDLLVSPFEP